MNATNSVLFYDLYEDTLDYSREILKGLSSEPRQLSPKFFYDERGSELFTEITRLPEYYLTRTEVGLLREHANEISSLIGDDFLLIEYGSGSSEKIRILLDNLKPSLYAPLDISRDYLAQAAEALGAEYPWLDIHATCVDFTAQFELPFQSPQRRIGFFPGSSIGNFDRPEAEAFLGRIRSVVGDNGGLLIGVDMKKDEALLFDAYNDSQGVTAAFNLNILTHLNREYDANFDTKAFRHEASYNAELGCIQMFLVSDKAQQIEFQGTTFDLAADEKIHTENSHKYTPQEVLDMAKRAGFASARTWQDGDALFGLFYLSAS